MKPPITTAQAMQHPDVVTTINTLGQMADELRTRLAEVEKDAERYQAIRNPPYSDNWGDLYAMTFQRTGDIPLKGADLDAIADSAIARAMGVQA